MLHEQEKAYTQKKKNHEEFLHFFPLCCLFARGRGIVQGSCHGGLYMVNNPYQLGLQTIHKANDLSPYIMMQKNVT